MSLLKIKSFFSKYCYEFYMLFLGVVFGATNTLANSITKQEEIFFSIFFSLAWVAFSFFLRVRVFKGISVFFFFLSIIFTYGYVWVFDRGVEFATLVGTFSFYMLLSFVSMKLLLIKKFLTYVLFLSIALFSWGIFFTLFVDIPFNEVIIQAILQTNFSEASEFFLWAFSVKDIVFFLLAVGGTFLGYYLMLRKFSQAKQELEFSVSLKIAFAILLIIFAIVSYQEKSFKGITNFKNGIKNYENTYRALETAIKNRAQTSHLYATKKEEQGELYLLIIGESLASANVSSYGYRIETTPKLSQSGAILFTNAFANYTHTIPALNLALTKANQYNKKSHTEVPSLISIAKDAGFKVAWLSTQSESGFWDLPITLLAKESDYVVFEGGLDGVLLPQIDKYLKTIDMSKNNLVILNMTGSHLSYSTRTKGLDIDLPVASKAFYNNKNNIDYDKSVRYTDILFAQILERLEQEKSFRGMIYFSDHGEDVFNNLGHEVGSFTETMAGIPLIIWLGNKFDKQRETNLIANKDKYFTNDLIFDSVLGILGIKTKAKNDAYDISSIKYEDMLATGLTVHGQKKIKELPTVHARQMLKKYPKLMAQKLTMIGSLEDAKRQDFKNIEFDIFYDKEAKKVLIGTENERTELTLGEFLSHEQGDFEKIQITINNMDDSKQLEILKELDVLDAKYNLKSRVVLETATLSEKNKNLTANGWQLSYTLPATVLEMEKTKSIEDINVYVNELKKQLLAQKIESISIDESLYPFLTKHVLDSLDNTSLNMRTSLSVGSLAFEENYLKKPWLNDKRVDTILVNRVVYF